MLFTLPIFYIYGSLKPLCWRKRTQFPSSGLKKILSSELCSESAGLWWDRFGRSERNWIKHPPHWRAIFDIFEGVREIIPPDWGRKLRLSMLFLVFDGKMICVDSDGKMTKYDLFHHEGKWLQTLDLRRKDDLCAKKWFVWIWTERTEKNYLCRFERKQLCGQYGKMTENELWITETSAHWIWCKMPHSAFQWHAYYELHRAASEKSGSDVNAIVRYVHAIPSNHFGKG